MSTAGSAAARIEVQVQGDVFDWQQLLASCSQGADTGAIASFIGQVRDSEPAGSGQQPLVAMEIEHYPGMTESAIHSICCDADQRWSFQHCVVVHRVGKLAAGEPIVLVMVASRHRANAFAACEYIMDKLKTEAPFWKKAIFADGERWVDAKGSDEDRAARWR